MTVERPTVTFPHMGNMDIVLKALLEGVGLKVIPPPPCSKETLSLGVQHSPEGACLPMKINIGNFLEAYRQGAKCVVMAGGVGPCRFGYYAQVQREILKDQGVQMEVVVLEPPDNHIGELLSRIKYLTGSQSWWRVYKAVRFAWEKALAADVLEREAQRLRPREARRGEVDRWYGRNLQSLDRAGSLKEVERVITGGLEEAKAIPLREVAPLKVVLVGEIYCLLEPFANGNMEKFLGSIGVEAVRSLYLSEWVNEHLFHGISRRVKGHKHARELARPYLAQMIGGHGQESIGSVIEYALEGYDGVIHLAPLSCMPEIVAHSLMPSLSKDYGIPVLTVYLDEHSGEAGLQTRLEAFVDLLARKRRDKGQIQEVGVQ